MRSVNKVIIIGNLTRDPSVRQTPSGQLVATFGIATNRQWVTKENDKQNSTEFHELVAWAKLAELAEKHLRKGKLVYVEGYLSTRSWETPEGVKKFKTEIVVQDMIMLNKRDDYPKNTIEKHTEKQKPEPVEKVIPEQTRKIEEVAVVSEEAANPEPITLPDIEEKQHDNIIDQDLGL